MNNSTHNQRNHDPRRTAQPPSTHDNHDPTLRSHNQRHDKTQPATHDNTMTHDSQPTTTPHHDPLPTTATQPNKTQHDTARHNKPRTHGHPSIHPSTHTNEHDDDDDNNKEERIPPPPQKNLRCEALRRLISPGTPNHRTATTE